MSFPARWIYTGAAYCGVTEELNEPQVFKLNVMNNLVILMLPLLIISCDQPKILIVADEWPQMDTLAARLVEHADYEIQKLEQDQIDSDLSAFFITRQVIR
jgi:hypothetical protein